MGIFSRLGFGKREADPALAKPTGTGIHPVGDIPFPEWLHRDPAMLLSTVYRCVDLISNSVATLPLNVFWIDKDGFKKHYNNHPAAELLAIEPSEDMTKYQFLRCMVKSLLLQGNGYAYIERDNNGYPIQLIFLPPNEVMVTDVPDATGLMHKRYYISPYRGRKFGHNGDGWVEPKDVIHVLNMSDDGLVGKSTISYAVRTLDISTASERSAEQFFKGGGRMSGILTVDGVPLSDEQAEQIYSMWDRRMQNRPGGMMVIEGNMKYSPISISPKDSQLLESRAFNVLDVCRFFSVSPVKAFDLSKSSYNTLEASQLSYLSETVQPYLVKIEEEINRKVFLRHERGRVRAEFDTSDFLRTDKEKQANTHATLFACGAITPNEIRKMYNLPRVEGGDKAFVQVNTAPLENAGKVPEVVEEIDVNDKNKEE